MEVADDDGAMALDGIDFTLDGIEPDASEVDLTYSVMKSVHTGQPLETENANSDLVNLFGQVPPLLQIKSCNESVNQSELSSSPVKTIDDLSLRGMESVSTSLEVLGSTNLDDIDFDFDNATLEEGSDSEFTPADLLGEKPEASWEENKTAEDTLTKQPSHPVLPVDPILNFPEENVSPLPVENVSPLSVGNVSPLPVENVSPLSVENVSPLPVENVSPLPEDNVSPPPVENNGKFQSLSSQVNDDSSKIIGETRTESQQEDDFEFDLPPNQASAQIPQLSAAKEDDDDEFDFEMPSVEPKDNATLPVKEDDFDVISSEPTQSEASQPDETKPIPTAYQIEPENGEVFVPSTVTHGSSDAEEAWDKVVTVVPTVAEDGEAVSAVSQVVPQALVSNREFVDFCQRSDWQVHLPNIHTTIERRGFSCLKHFIFGPPKLRPDLMNERDMVFCLAASPLNNNQPLHIRVLQTIYRKLTGSKFDCARYGSHWEDIGFQGNDPATDLRSVGILSLLQILHLVSDARYSALARDIYSLSTHETQNFPFCIMGINMTRVALLTLREGSLNKECNRQSEVLSPFNDLYVSIYFHLYRLWKSGQKTIADTGFVLKDVEDLARKSPKTLLDNLRSHVESCKKKEVESVEGVMNFMDVCAEEQ